MTLKSLMTPSPGVCGRCYGAATFYPTRVPLPDGSSRIEAMLVCPCCSYAACQHHCPFVDGQGVQCRGRYGHMPLGPAGARTLHDCPPGRSNIRVAQYSQRFEPPRQRKGKKA
jgi:hypothetical protein